MSVIGSWSSFFVAEVGAAAALAGLLFVSISLNIGEILKSPKPPIWMGSRVVITVLGTVVAPVAGIVLIAGESWGFYVLAAAILTTFAVAVINAWVFLVEILR